MTDIIGSRPGASLTALTVQSSLIRLTDTEAPAASSQTVLPLAASLPTTNSIYNKRHVTSYIVIFSYFDFFKVPRYKQRERERDVESFCIMLDIFMNGNIVTSLHITHYIVKTCDILFCIEFLSPLCSAT